MQVKTINHCIIKIVDILGSDVLLSKKHLRTRFEHIWETQVSPKANYILLPRSAEDVATICRICNEYKQSIIIHGGLTGLVGATKSSSDDFILSLERLNQLEEIDELNQVATVQAGVIIEELQSRAEESGLYFPMSFGAIGSARIGGCIATNAGGVQVIKYGMMRNLVLGLEVVLPDGTIINGLKKLIKNNSGYNLDQLFIGSEGTLGIITKAVVKLIPKPKKRCAAFLAFNDFNQIIKGLNILKLKFNDQLRSFEVIWRNTYNGLTKPPSPFSVPIKTAANYYVLIELIEAEYPKFELVLEKLLENEVCVDAVPSNVNSEIDTFWKIRENVSILNNLSSYQQHFDISIPLHQMETYVDSSIKKINMLNAVENIFAFGHIADHNIHFIVGKKNDSSLLKDQIDKMVYEPLLKLKGYISAEHGIGVSKKKWLHYCRSKEEIQLMKMLKKTMDPKNILNPGRIIDI